MKPNKKIYISLDVEGPLGMYPKIKKSNDLLRYQNWDIIFDEILQIHQKKNIPVSLGILASMALSDTNEFKKYINKYPLELIPNNSLIKRFLNDREFRNIIQNNERLFFK